MNPLLRIFTLALILCHSSHWIIASAVRDGNGPGSWHVYESFAGPPQRVVDTGRQVYYLSGGRLFSYNAEEKETKAYTTGNILNGKNIVNIFYNAEGKFLVVCYDSGVIDLLYDNGKVVNISDIADSGISGPVAFNDIEFRGNRFYVATDFGIVEFDAGRRRAVKSGNYGVNVSGVAIVGDNLFFVADDTLRMAGDNISRLSLSVPLMHAGSAGLFSPGGNSLLMLDGRVMLARINAGIPEAESIRQISAEGITDWIPQSNGLYYYGNGMLYRYDAETEREEKICVLPADAKEDIIGLSPAKGNLWALSRHGIAGYRIAGGECAEVICERHKPSGMSVKEVCGLVASADGKRLYAINHGPTSYRYGFPEGDNGYSIPGALSCIGIEDGGIEDITPYPVKALSDITLPLQNGYGPYPFAMTSVVEHPDDSNVLFTGTGNDGLYMIRDGKFAGRYDSSNSPLRPVWGWIVYSLAFDRGGNLWVVSNHDNYTDQALMILPHDKTLLDPAEVRVSDWIIPDADGYHGDMDSRILVCRNSGMIFIIDKLKPQILLACDTRNTPGNLADDRFRLYGEIYDQDGNSLSDCVVSSIMEDKDGSVWLGTFERGIYRISNPSEAVVKEITAWHLKVPRNDGSGLADYLLADEIINDMAVDGSGHKWIATENSGLYVVSADGTGIISHYTPDNSPLQSNAVYSLYAVRSGRDIYIGTPDGLLRYTSPTAADSGSLASLHIYPNPVRPGYSGPVRIDGLTDGALVRIADASGNVVGHGRAEGGTFTWNVSHSISAGVYYVTAGSPDGDNAFGKIVIVN